MVSLIKLFYFLFLIFFYLNRFLYHPSKSFYSTKSAYEFALYDERAKKSLQCTQKPGDIIYVPSLW
jgi:hypothetical protein